MNGVESAVLHWRNVDVIPLIHGRLPFAILVRECLLARRYAAVAVELPRSLAGAVMEGVRLLPRVHAVVYQENPLVDTEAAGRAWYVPLDPCDGIVEALRIADRERTPIVWMDAEVEQFAGQSLLLPDAHAVLHLGAAAFYRAVLPTLRELHPRGAEDRLRERHMAQRLQALAEDVGEGRVLFLCGMAHWAGIHARLQTRRHELHAAEGPDPEWIRLVMVHHDSLPHLLGETPFTTHSYETHRSSLDWTRYDPIAAAKDLLLEARELHRERSPRSLERAAPAALRKVLEYTRKLTLYGRRLTPDLYSLVVAAKGVVGNDFALAVLDVARRYPPNEPEPEGTEEQREGGGQDVPGLDAAAAGGEEDDEPRDDPADPVLFSEHRARLQEGIAELISRTPGERRELRRVRLQERPPPMQRHRWRTAWNPFQQCSWPPEDVVVENFRSYVTQRTLALAGLERVRIEEFLASLKDGIAMRETLRDVTRGKIHVKEEPRVPGRVGAVVVIFEEDDAGTRYPWRTTWLAEHPGESTLAFYATNYLDDMVGPGIGRARYGGCMFLYPPMLIADIWEDLTFEKARRPSERLLLAALYYATDRFVAHVSATPPSSEVQSTAQSLGKHVVHLPLSAFSSTTLERIRRVHVLNGQLVRKWAGHFIR